MIPPKDAAPMTIPSSLPKKALPKYSLRMAPRRTMVPAEARREKEEEGDGHPGVLEIGKHQQARRHEAEGQGQNMPLGEDIAHPPQDQPADDAEERKPGREQPGL